MRSRSIAIDPPKPRPIGELPCRYCGAITEPMFVVGDLDDEDDNLELCAACFRKGVARAEVLINERARDPPTPTPNSKPKPKPKLKTHSRKKTQVPNIRSFYSSKKFLRADDLGGKPKTFTIAGVEVSTLPDGKDQLVLSFREVAQKFGLNKTNAVLIGELYGLESDDWIGKQVRLRPTQVEYQGRVVDTIRVDNGQPMNEGDSVPF